MNALNSVIESVKELRRRVQALEIREHSHSRLAELYLGGDDRTVAERIGKIPSSDDLNSISAIPSGLAWAGAPFVTPASPSFQPSQIWFPNSSMSGGKSFLYGSNVSTMWHRFGIASTVSGMAAGLRWDDGTDNNYAEIISTVTVATPGTAKVIARKRTGGGAITDAADGAVLYTHETFALRGAAEGTLWSNWSLRPLLYGDLGQPSWQPSVTGLTFTPTRAGFVMYTNGNSLTYLGFYLDSLRFT